MQLRGWVQARMARPGWRGLGVAVWAAGLLVAPRVHADEGLDTRLTFVFGDDDFLAATGRQHPVSPGPGFGNRAAYQLFYDNLDTRFDSRESITHLVLHRTLPGFAEDVTTEAAVVLRVGLEPMSLVDTGSFIRVHYGPFADAPNDGLALTLFPFDSERYRLGYLYDLSFGGAEFLSYGSLVRAPAARLSFDRGPGRYHLGVKTIPARTGETLRLDDGSPAGAGVEVTENYYSVLGGASFDLLHDRLRLEAGAGYFQQGRLVLADYPRAALHTLGAAARVVFRENLPIEESIDFQLYRHDPNQPLLVFRAPTYVPGQLGYLVSAEATALGQRLADVDSPGRMTDELGYAGALMARVQYGYLRVEATALLRDLPFIARNTARAAPVISVPRQAEATPERFFALHADYHFPDPRLTLGGSGGVRLPATLTQAGDPTDPRGGTLVVREEGWVTALPVGRSAAPIVAARLHARLDLSELLYTQLFVQYVYDPNTAQLTLTDETGTRTREEGRHRLGAGLSAAARF